MQTASHHIERALSLIQLRKPDLALHEARRAVELEPESAEAHECMAWVLRALKRLDEAREAALTALRHDPQLGDAHTVLALICWQQAQILEARRAFAEAYRLQNGDMLFLADVYAQFLNAINDQAQALEVVETALVRFPNAARLHTRRGVLLARTNAAEAETAFREALRLDPRQQEAHTGMGRLHLAARRSAEALSSFRESLRLHPHDNEARAGLVQALKARNAFYGGFLALLLNLRRNGAGSILSKATRTHMVLILIVPILLLLGLLLLNSALGSPVEAVWLPIAFGLYYGILTIPFFFMGMAKFSWSGLIEPLFNLLLLFDPENRGVVEIDLGSTISSLLSGCTILMLMATIGAAMLGAPDEVGVPMVGVMVYLGGMAALARSLVVNDPDWFSPRWLAFGSVGLGGGILLLFVAFNYVRESLQLASPISFSAPVILVFGFSMLLFLVGLVLTLSIWLLDARRKWQERQQLSQAAFRRKPRLVPLGWQALLMGAVLVGILSAVALAEVSPPLALLVGFGSVYSAIMVPMLINPAISATVPLFDRLVAANRRKAALVYGAGLLLLLLLTCGVALLAPA
ncbi:MAG: tetratricopeptide repeat protein [Chloroflexaceae bacterium]|jgi:tetratricopeptide (TPR) repeat protein|nr:tetratricopeptide repeat protein [Chloroflexaceae bacterium]